MGCSEWLNIHSYYVYAHTAFNSSISSNHSLDSCVHTCGQANWVLNLLSSTCPLTCSVCFPWRCGEPRWRVPSTTLPLTSYGAPSASLVYSNLSPHYMSAFITTNPALKYHPLLPQVVATFTQRSDSTPSKAYEEASASFETIDTGARSFPRIPEQQASSSSASTASHSATHTTRMECQQLQQVGDEHVFHQKVCMGLQVYW